LPTIIEAGQWLSKSTKFEGLGNIDYNGYSRYTGYAGVTPRWQG